MKVQDFGLELCRIGMALVEISFFLFSVMLLSFGFSGNSFSGDFFRRISTNRFLSLVMVLCWSKELRSSLKVGQKMV